MSKNVSILEGGQSRAFGHIQKLKTAKSGGGSVLWVDEDETETKSLYVTVNGTYVAADGSYVATKTYYVTEGGKRKKKTKKVIKKSPDKACYGYDEVDVNIIESVTGYKDKGGIDSPYDVWVDDDGFLVEDELPVRIEIVTPPTKTSYITAEPINTDGMVVKAYYADDSEWGEVSRDEYTIDPLVAIGGGNVEYSDGNGVVCWKLSMSDAYWKNPWGQEIQYSTKVVGENTYRNMGVQKNNVGDYYVTVYNTQVYMKKVGSNEAHEIQFCNLNPDTSDWGWNVAQGRSNGWASSGSGIGSLFSYLPRSTSDPCNAGTLTPTGSTITVSWVPSDDVDELTDTFQIIVNAPPTPTGDNSGGSSGGVDTNPITPHV